MKKIILLRLLPCCLLLPALIAMLISCGSETSAQPPPEQAVTLPAGMPDDVPKLSYVVDFSDGKTDFIKVNTAVPGADKETTAAIANADGAGALALTAPGGGAMYIGINVSGLLGDRSADVRRIVFDVYSEYPDGTFRAVGGEIAAIGSDGSIFAKDTWTIYLDTRNPNRGMLEFGEGQSFSAEGPDILEFSCITNGPAERGETPAIIYIKSVTFYDSADIGLPVNTMAGWSAPEGYAESSADWEIEITDAIIIDEKFIEIYTWGRDAEKDVMTAPDNRTEIGTDDYLPWEILAASYGIAFEVNEPEGFVFINNSSFNGWSWNQNDNQPYTYEDGILTVMWSDTNDMDTSKITESDWACKLRFGSWNTPMDFKSVRLIMG